MGQAREELGFSHFVLKNEKWNGSRSRFNARQVEGELQKQLHDLTMGSERLWRHADMGAARVALCAHCASAWLRACVATPPRRHAAHPRPSTPPPQYKDTTNEWVKVFLTYSNKVKPALARGKVRINK